MLHAVSGQNDPKRAKSWTIRFNCPIQMGFIHISFSSVVGGGELLLHYTL